MAIVASTYQSILDLFSIISGLAAEYPKLTGTISVGAMLTALWAYWRRPIINVRLGKKEGSYGTIDDLNLKNSQGGVVPVSIRYFRVRVKNAGLTTIKDCSGQLIKVTRRVVGKAPAIFDTDACNLGWAHHPQSDTRIIPRGTSFQMDVATLVLPPSGGSQLFVGGHGRQMPSTLLKFLNSYSGKATYTLEVLITADNARPRSVPVEVAFDPEQTDLSYIPLNTRYPWWRLWWWLRVQGLRRRDPGF